MFSFSFKFEMNFTLEAIQGGVQGREKEGRRGREGEREKGKEEGEEEGRGRGETKRGRPTKIDNRD